MNIKMPVLDNKPLRICFIAKPASIHTQRWLKWFATRGHDVHLIAVGNMSHPIDNVKVDLEFPGYTLKNPRFWLRHLMLRKVLRNIKPDILHAHFVDDCGWLALLSGFHPYVVTIWGSDIRLLPARSRTGIGKYITSLTLINSDLITSVSQELANMAIQLGAAPEKIKIVLWGVDLRKFNGSIDTSDVKKKLSIENALVVLSPRNLEKVYNIETIIRSIPAVIGEIPNVKYVFLGDGSLNHNLKTLVRSLEVENNVVFAGRIAYEDIPKYYNLADVCVSVSTSDGTPSSMLEAMACNLPLIVSDIPPYHEWIIENKNGLYVSMFDHQALSSTTLALLKDRDLRMRMGNENVNLIKERADEWKCLLNMEKLYYSLLDLRSGMK